MNHNGQKIDLIDKRGDYGTTSLFSGERVSKSSLRPEALGDLDELGSVLGLARYHAKKKRIKTELLDLQRELFVVGSQLATTHHGTPATSHPLLDKNWLDQFERKVKNLHEATAIPKGFVISGRDLSAAYLHQARAVARRCERKVVRLFEAEEISNKRLLAFFNRLSVYLFLMAQYEDAKPNLAKI